MYAHPGGLWLLLTLQETVEISGAESVGITKALTSVGRVSVTYMTWVIEWVL